MNIPGEQMKLDMEHVVQCPMCGDMFPEIDVHWDDELCWDCEGKWVEHCEEMTCL